MRRRAAPDGSSTLFVTLILLLLSGSCLALLISTQTEMLISSREKLRARLYAAAEGGLEIGVARGVAGAVEGYSRALDIRDGGVPVTIEISGFEPMAFAPCHLCAANAGDGVGMLGGLARASHAISASATAPSSVQGLPPPRRTMTAVVDLMPWPAGAPEQRDLARHEAIARSRLRELASSAGEAYDDEAPFALAVVGGPVGGVTRTVAVGGPGRSGRSLHAVELSPRPGPLWSFFEVADDDENDAVDIGYAASRPTIARLRWLDGDRWAVLFGGGFDPAAPATVGNWLYMTALESGELLYKRPLDAPVTASPAAADVDGDGVIDRIYVGTVAGSVYRVDASSPPLTANGRVEAGSWRPRQVFRTSGLPIHQSPAVVPLPALRANALVLGAGGGRDPAAIAPTPRAGRLLLVVDRGADRLVAADELPGLDAETPGSGVDRLAVDLDPGEQGWSLPLGERERLASPPLSIGGLVAFVTFTPNGAESGEVRQYAVSLRSGDALDGVSRARLLSRNAPWPSAGLGSPRRLDVDHAGGSAAPLLGREEGRVLEALRDELPARCRRNESRVRVTGTGPDDTALELAVLPVCRLDVDWVEEGPL